MQRLLEGRHLFQSGYTKARRLLEAGDCLRPALIRDNMVCERVSSLMNMEFDSEPVYGDSYKYIKTKIKLSGDMVNTNFQSNKIPKEMHHKGVCH